MRLLLSHIPRCAWLGREMQLVQEEQGEGKVVCRVSGQRQQEVLKGLHKKVAFRDWWERWRRRGLGRGRAASGAPRQSEAELTWCGQGVARSCVAPGDVHRGRGRVVAPRRLREGLSSALTGVDAAGAFICRTDRLGFHRHLWQLCWGWG